MKRSVSNQFLHDPYEFVATQASILSDSAFNKGTAFTKQERAGLKLRGLLPPQVETLEQQCVRALRQFRAFDTPLERYIYLISLQNRNETLFYRLLIDNLVEMMPIVYTPTVGEACIKFDEVWRNAQGMYLSLEDKGDVRSILNNWRNTPDIIVVTDGSRILGLGDLGANGMGIPIGKLSLYVAGAGFHPRKTLPIALDVGTNNENLLKDELYLGLRQKRVRGPEFYEFVDEFLMAVQSKWPECLVQFEDFSNDVCFDLLEKYRNQILCFNDDIQGTGAVIVSGFLNAAKLTGIRPSEHKLVFLGAGSAAVGVADQIVGVMKLDNPEKTEEELRKNIFFVDSKGLVTKHRGGNLEKHKEPYAQDIKENITSLLDVVKHVKPTGLIGLSGQGGSFTQDIVEEAAKHSEKPIIFALSNPTKNSECTAEQAVQWTDGKCIFASGSPFPVVNYKGKEIKPGQGNNMYIFPGLGLGAVVCKAKHVSELMVLAASQTLAACTPQEKLDRGEIYPDLSDIRNISFKIAKAVAEQAVKEGLSDLVVDNWEPIIREYIYQPEYVKH